MLRAPSSPGNLRREPRQIRWSRGPAAADPANNPRPTAGSAAPAGPLPSPASRGAPTAASGPAAGPAPGRPQRRQDDAAVPRAARRRLTIRADRAAARRSRVSKPAWPPSRGAEWARRPGASPPMRMAASWFGSRGTLRIQARGARSAPPMASSPPTATPPSPLGRAAQSDTSDRGTSGERLTWRAPYKLAPGPAGPAMLRLLPLLWSGTLSSSPRSRSTLPTKPSAWRRARWNTSRSISTSSIAKSE
jgi:hypothetical protein